MEPTLRLADSGDGPAIAALIARSARRLGARDYAPQVIECALTGAFGLDSQLVADRTYFVFEHEGRLAACGGWSYRRTLFGADSAAVRDATPLDPKTERARIRAFFVAPDYARRGLGRQLIGACERAAHARGYHAFALMATLTGVPLYEAAGYVAQSPIDHELAPGVTIRFVPMHKGVPGEAPVPGSGV